MVSESDDAAGAASADPGTEMEPPDWASLIAGAAGVDGCPAPVKAREHVESLSSASQPQKIRCEDGQLYAVKFLTNPYGNGRAIYAEQVVPLLGALIGAPVPQVTPVFVSGEFVAVSTFRIGAMPPTEGLHHGSLWVENCSDREGIAHVNENRDRLGALSVLYTWAHCAGDHQLIYANEAPHAVLSVDHSAFFGDQGSWTPQSLAAHPDAVAYDAYFDPADLNDVDRSAALDALSVVSPQDLVQAVAAPPLSWGVNNADRAALAAFLNERRSQVLALSGRVTQ